MHIKHTRTLLPRVAKFKKAFTLLNSGQDVEKLEFLYIPGGNIKWHNPFGKLFGNLVKNTHLVSNSGRLHL